MRAFMLIGSVIVLLIVSILVIKNMGGDLGGGVSEKGAKQIIERAEDTVDEVEDKVKDIQKKLKLNN